MYYFARKRKTEKKEEADVLLLNAAMSHREIKKTMERKTSLALVFFAISISIILGVVQSSSIKIPQTPLTVDANTASAILAFISSLLFLSRTLDMINLYYMKRKIVEYFEIRYGEEADLDVFSSLSNLNLINKVYKTGLRGKLTSLVILSVFISVFVIYIAGSLQVTLNFTLFEERILYFSFFIFLISGPIEIFNGKIIDYINR